MTCYKLQCSHHISSICTLDEVMQYIVVVSLETLVNLKQFYEVLDDLLGSCSL